MKQVKTGKRMPSLRLAALLLAVIMFVFTLGGCSSKTEEDSDIIQIKQIAQKYFDALKANDTNGACDCYLPSEREKMEAEYGILGFAGQLLFHINIADLFSDLITLLGLGSGYEDYKYKVVDAEVDKEWKEGKAYIEVYESNNDYRGCVQISMTEYDGKWYVVKGSIVDTDRPQVVADTSVEPEKDNSTLMIVIIISVGAVVIAAAAIIFIKNFRPKRKANASYLDPLDNSGDSEEIFCPYCAASNPIGVRACIACGRKLKKRR